MIFNLYYIDYLDHTVEQAVELKREEVAVAEYFGLGTVLGGVEGDPCYFSRQDSESVKTAFKRKHPKLRMETKRVAIVVF